MSEDMVCELPNIIQKSATGIPGLDVILEKGLITNRSYLLLGSAGSGKTIFSVQWLLDGIRRGETCVYITLAERSEEIKLNVSAFGWDLSKINFLDLSPSENTIKPDGQEYHVFSPSEVEIVSAWEKIYEIVQSVKPSRLVIDSATQLRYLATDEYQFRKHILDLITYLNMNKVTSFLLFEPCELEKETSIGLAVDGIFRLKSNLSKTSLVSIRSFQVEKLRGTAFLSGSHQLKIGNEGIHIFPHIIEPVGSPTPGKYLVDTGIAKLDELLHGGLESGTTTIISGPTGVGKSILGMQLLINACKNGKRGILFAFEESINSIRLRCKGLGTPIDDLLESGALKILRVNAMAVYPDQFLEMVRDYVINDKVDIVVLDSLRGYQLSMQEYGTLLYHVQNLVAFLSRNGVNTILINEVEAITGNLSVTELGVSHLADNVILIRYAEYDGQVIKVIACLKKRLGNFQPELRKISISSDGIDIGDKLVSLEKILTGIPSYVK